MRGVGLGEMGICVGAATIGLVCILIVTCPIDTAKNKGIHGEHTESVGGVYDISNKRRLGLTEIQAIREMKDGVLAVIDKEKKLAAAAAALQQQQRKF